MHNLPSSFQVKSSNTINHVITKFMTFILEADAHEVQVFQTFNYILLINPYTLLKETFFAHSRHCFYKCVNICPLKKQIIKFGIQQ
jgi:hypothetical protein